MSVPYRIMEFINKSKTKVRLMSIWNKKDHQKVVSIKHLILLKLPFSDSDINRAKCEILADVIPNAVEKVQDDPVKKRLRSLPLEQKIKVDTALQNLELWNNIAKDSKN